MHFDVLQLKFGLALNTRMPPYCPKKDLGIPATMQNKSISQNQNLINNTKRLQGGITRDRKAITFEKIQQSIEKKETLQEY